MPDNKDGFIFVIPWKKRKMELPYGPEILLLGVCPKELKAESQTHICIPVFTAALFSQEVEASHVNRWTNKEDVVNTYNEMLLSLKQRKDCHMPQHELTMKTLF